MTHYMQYLQHKCTTAIKHTGTTTTEQNKMQ